MPATVCKTICQLFSLLFEPLHKAVQLYLVSAFSNVGDLNVFDFESGSWLVYSHMFIRVTAKVIVLFILWEVIRRNNEPLLDITQSFKGWEGN